MEFNVIVVRIVLFHVSSAFFTFAKNVHQTQYECSIQYTPNEFFFILVLITAILPIQVHAQVQNSNICIFSLI